MTRTKCHILQILLTSHDTSTHIHSIAINVASLTTSCKYPSIVEWAKGSALYCTDTALPCHPTDPHRPSPAGPSEMCHPKLQSVSLFKCSCCHRKLGKPALPANKVGGSLSRYWAALARTKPSTAWWPSSARRAWRRSLPSAAPSGWATWALNMMYISRVTPYPYFRPLLGCIDADLRK